MLKLVVLNKDATFRLQTSTGLLNLAVLQKDTTLKAADFISRSKNRSGWKTFSPAVPVMAAGCKIRSMSQIYAQLQL